MKKVWLVLISLAIIAGSYYFLSNKALAPVSEPLESNSAGEKIPVIIVPHFNDFAAKRSALLKQLGANHKSKTVIVVSVNHFNAGNADITTADRTWTLSGGNVSADSELVKKLSASGIASADSNPFVNEFGITNVLPDVRDNIGGKILPIIIKDTTPRAQIDKLAAWIDQNAAGNILVASVDFSHYQPNALAQIHDQYSIQALASLDADKTWSAETDSPQTLYLSELIAKKNQTTNFHLYYNSNSGAAAGNDDMETTSVVLGYYSDKSLSDAEKITPTTSFVIAGDAMFDRNVWQTCKPDLKNIFTNFGTRVFQGVDAPILNLEGPISSTPVPGIQTGGMSFNFQPQVPSVLKYLNVGAVSLANNHSNNQGAAGLSSTRSMLTKSGVKYFGVPEGFDSDASLYRVNGPLPLTFIGIMALDSFDESALESSIKSEKAAGRGVIIFPHWGVEYQTTHTPTQEQLAKSWIAAGADAVIGSHPHVVEDFQMIDGRPVIYSLGNFVFDQFFSNQTQQGLIIAGSISKDKIRLTFLPTQEKNIKPQFMTGAAKTAKIFSILNIDSQIGFKKISSDTIEIQR